MNYRDKLYSKLLKCKQPDPNHRYLYKKFRNKVVKDLKDSKSTYFNQYFSLNKYKMQKLWSGIRSIINIGKCKNSYTTSILNNNKSVDNPNDIADIFNNFFANIGKTTEKGIPRGSQNPLFYLRGNYSGSIFLSPVTSNEIWAFIGKMDASKSSGPYSVPVTILKIIRDYISEPLAFLVNDSFASGNFPEKLKLARITPVFKKGSRSDIDNYRPISVLSNFSKLFEKAMYHRLYNYLEEFKILYPLQFGFREKCSTTHALISITESIRQSIDNNEFGCGIFIDLKKAFDTVNHTILLTKLNHYGIRGVVLDWFKSYLSQRAQFVNINGHNSLSLPVTCGVPQGSILGPLLFLLYVNDLPNTSSLLTFHLFADDTNIYFSSKNLSHLEATLNCELKSVAEWMKCNRLALSISKTNFILFHSSKLKPNQSLRIKIDDTPIKQVDSTKYLGITFDSNLTWKSHVNELCLKLSKTVGILSKVRHFVNKHILVMLYYSLIYPFLTYGVHVWGLTFPSFLTQLFIIQKKAIRIISFSEPKSHSEPLFKSLDLLKLNDVIELQILSFVYQWSHRLLPPCFSEYFKFTSSVHSYSTRQSSKRNLYLASVNTTQYGL